ncbi:hypothetical protein DLJ53_04405 [Acuticoccus sediminis]|uniref:Uncharacterized protein n=1 Tax=Acuticoccus sediminis TaxID=2184697 RepID=A0A8B2NU53_9HYPH|nr:hypothetical protein DLJ53_04405 [Acuticoccus sediminis]
MSNEDDNTSPKGDRRGKGGPGGGGGRRRRPEGAAGGTDAGEVDRAAKRAARRARRKAENARAAAQTAAAAPAARPAPETQPAATEPAARAPKAPAQKPAETAARSAAERPESAKPAATAEPATPDPAPTEPVEPAVKPARTAKTVAMSSGKPSKKNPYILLSDATAPSFAIGAALADRLLGAAIDAADAYFRQYVAATGSVTDEYRAAIAKTLAFNRETAASPTFREDEFVATAVLVALLEPELVVLAGAKADAVAAAYATSKARVLAVAKDADTFARAIARDTFVEGDFGAHDFGTLPSGSLAHIADDKPTARRLLEAEAKGFDAAVVTNSPGITGIVRQGLSAVPTLPMIVHADRFAVGDTISWSNRRRRFDVTVTEAMLDEMQRARDVIDRVVPFPSLEDEIALPLEDRSPARPALVLFR